MDKPNLFCAALTSIVTHDLSALQAARDRVNRTLEHDPIQPAAIVAFTLLELFDGQADKANKLVAPLVKNFPRNPFYQMAATEIVFHKQNLPNDAAIDMLRKAIPGDSKDLMQTLAARGELLLDLGRYKDAEQTNLEAVQMAQRLVPGRRPLRLPAAACDQPGISRPSRGG